MDRLDAIIDILDLTTTFFPASSPRIRKSVRNTFHARFHCLENPTDPNHLTKAAERIITG